MKHSENIRAAAALQPDLMGFIFYEKSPRYALDNLQFTVDDVLLTDIKKVGVFVNESVEMILSAAKRYQLDFIQLHGNETPMQCLNLLNADLGVIKAFSIAESADFEQTEEYEGCCDYFLFDTKTPQHGGSGKQFDWSLLEHYKGKTPFLLSGGIGLEDAEMLHKIKHPLLAGFDVNSKFEIEPGLKNIDKLRQFSTQMTQIRQIYTDGKIQAQRVNG